ncbi:MAG: prepilin-type N-terminal cleavage/methylation domain-containing protein [Patescibacteria group bacterium]
MSNFTRKSGKGFTLIELLVVIAIIGLLSSIVLASLSSARSNGRDSKRVSEIRQIQYALELYYNSNLQYPTCLYTASGCTTTLQGSAFMKNVPKDPLSGLGYSYAGNGSGANCSSYHLGTSLENNKNNKILQTGSDATVQAICTGSPADFSGLSYAAGGQLCNTTAGIAQPTAVATGETCYDLKPN